MIKDTFKLLIFLLPLILIMALTNYFVDPGNIYKTRSFEKEIVKVLASGMHVAFPVSMSQVDEVVILKKTVDNFSEKPDLLVLGSSRALPISGSLFNVPNFYNAAISSCKVGDLVATYNLFDKRNLAPKAVLISVDPDFFVLPPWTKNEHWDDFWSLIKKIGINISKRDQIEIQNKIYILKIQKFLELFSPAYFQDSIKLVLIKKYGLNLESFNNKKVQKRDIRKLTYWATTENHAKGGVIFPDGSRQFSDEQLNLKGEAKLTNAIGQIKGMDRIKANAHALLPISTNIFEAFITYLLNHGVQVIFLLVPEHSLLYNYEYSLYGNQSAPIVVENYIRNFAKERNIFVWGSFNIRNTKFTDDDMVDQHHPNRDSIHKLFNF